MRAPPSSQPPGDEELSGRSIAPTQVSRDVVALGWTSFFTDVSSEMIVPLLPLFLTTVLGGGALALGWVEGIAETVANVMKLVSGRLADRAGRFRPFVVAGYSLSALARPLMALAARPWHVVLVRAVDRTGKGLRTSPRDAMIAAATEEGGRGSAFGLQRAMDHAGSVAGPLIAIFLFEVARQDLRTIFWLAAIPGAIAVAVLVIFVREPRQHRPAGAQLPSGGQWPEPALRRLLAPFAVFALGKASDLFLLLQFSGPGTGPVELSLLWIGLHIVKSISSLAAGRLADRFGPRAMIASGWIVYAAVYLGLAAAGDRTLVVALCLVYGVYHGLTEGNEKALVAKVVTPEHRGTAFGWYHLTVGGLALPASLLFGALWQTVGPAASFTLGAGLATAAVALLLALRPASLTR